MTLTPTLPATAPPRLWTAVRRGWQRRCPRCGEGALFSRGITVNDSCSHCGLRFQRDNGDTWMFIVITDRVPLLFAIAALYFGFRPGSWLLTSAFYVAIITPIVVTLRQRKGVALALDYLVTFYLDDPS